MSVHRLSPRDVDALDRAVGQATPTDDGARNAATFDVEWEGWTYRVIVQARPQGLTPEHIKERRERGT